MNDNKKQFLESFHKLLIEHDVDMTVDDHYQGYSECGQDLKITLSSSYWNYVDLEVSYVDADLIRSLIDKAKGE